MEKQKNKAENDYGGLLGYAVHISEKCPHNFISLTKIFDVTNGALLPCNLINLCQRYGKVLVNNNTFILSLKKKCNFEM